jgi:hypothetical protein
MMLRFRRYSCKWISEPRRRQKTPKIPVTKLFEIDKRIREVEWWTELRGYRGAKLPRAVKTLFEYGNTGEAAIICTYMGNRREARNIIKKQLECTGLLTQWAIEDTGRVTEAHIMEAYSGTIALCKKLGEHMLARSAQKDRDFWMGQLDKQIFWKAMAHAQREGVVWASH